MNKIIRYTLLCAIIITGLYSCGGSTNKTETFTSEEVSFNYPQGWKITKENWDIPETENLTDSSLFVKAKGDGCVIMIFVASANSVKSEDNIKSFLKGTKRKDVDFSSKEIKPDKFGKYNSRSAEYLIINSKKVKVYGAVHTFEINGKTVLVAQQANSERKLSKKFKDIETSFDVVESEKN